MSHNETVVEQIASFVEHMRDDYVSTMEPVSKVARMIREKFGSGNQAAQEPADATRRSEAPKTPSD